MNSSALHFAQALGHEATDKRLDILKRIGEVGSISEAARSANVSYKAAWQALETLSNLAGAPLVEKAVGGSGILQRHATYHIIGPHQLATAVSYKRRPQQQAAAAGYSCRRLHQ